jgi:hypothetical protein
MGNPVPRKRRPTHHLAAYQMRMKMPDALQGIGSIVENQPVAALEHAGFLCDDLCCQQNLASYDLVIGIQGIERGDVLDRNDQGMNGRRRIDVPERKDMLVPVDDRCRDLPSGNPAEKTIRIVT